MRRIYRRHKRQIETAELNVTPFMNLMIVLVPVLLLSMVFSYTTVIDLNFPSADATGKLDPDSVHLEIQVLADELVVADRRSIIKRLPRLESGEHDYETLSLVLQELKRRVPEKRDATILLETDTDYQALVFTMDKARSFDTSDNGETIATELFPVLSLGDAPGKTKAPGETES
jgi:biopolymer transport protein ExbD